MPTPIRDQWSIEQDVRTLKEAKIIRKDPARLQDAKSFIRQQRTVENAILNTTQAQNTRRPNPASRGKLPNPITQ